MMKNAKLTKHISNGIIYTILSVLSIIWILPIVWLILQSFRAEGGAFTYGYIIPKEYTLDNYTRLFTDTSMFNYSQWYVNTFIVAVLSCIISTMFVLMVSYALSRLRFKARRPIMNVALILGMFPGFMSMIAVYHMLKAVGLDKSLAALVLVYSAGTGLGYYIAKGFFDTIPRALDEAATIDGANKNQIFWKITLPMSKPIITYTVLTSFMAPWLDFIFASVILKDDTSKYTIALGLFQFLTRERIDAYFTRFCAGAVMIAVPITILFMCMQRYYVEGVAGGSVKG